MAPAGTKSKALESMGLSFHGEGGTLFGIHILNIFLTIITLGVYHFWAKVKLRKYLWSQFEFAGDRFGYHGTVREIAVGWMKAMAAFGVPYVLLSHGPTWFGLGKVGIIVGALASVVLVMVFIPFAIVGSRRYRLSRTSWRGMRFSFRGKAAEFFMIYLKGTLLSLVTLGLYSPYFHMKLQAFLTRKTYLGNRQFIFDGNADDLMTSYVIALLLAIPTLFISLAFYSVKVSVYNWAHTHIGDARFRSTITLWSSFKMMFTCALLVIITLGFGASWAQARYLRFIADNLFMDGDADLNSIAQEAIDTDATAEELAGFLDLDLGFN